MWRPGVVRPCRPWYEHKCVSHAERLCLDPHGCPSTRLGKGGESVALPRVTSRIASTTRQLEAPYVCDETSAASLETCRVRPADGAGDRASRGRASHCLLSARAGLGSQPLRRLHGRG